MQPTANTTDTLVAPDTYTNSEPTHRPSPAELESIQRGEEDIAAGRFVSLEEAMKRFRSRYNL
ncbi:MAG: hypothetical protein LBO69_09795 [Ignavibacteria bacterium]|jgi:hypothetical protein|nr:hypothetical protein [Ignavibacteria bacterium]